MKDKKESDPSHNKTLRRISLKAAQWHMKSKKFTFLGYKITQIIRIVQLKERVC